MALLVPLINLDSGLTVTSTYAKIDTISGYKDNIGISLKYFMNQQAVNDGKAHIKQDIFNFTPSVEDGSPNFIKQGYEYLKSLPEFATAIDILE